MDEDKILLLLLGGAIGLASSLVSLLLKSFLDHRARDRERQREALRERRYREIASKGLEQGDPLMEFEHWRQSLKRKLEEGESWDSEARDLARLYIQVCEQTWKLSERRLTHWKDEAARNELIGEKGS